MTAMVGVIANPASGRDIRRLVSGASVCDNAEKGSMVCRLMARLGAAGIERVLMMPTAASVVANLQRQLRSATIRLPALEFVDMQAEESARDTETAVQLMCAEGAAGIAVLGGDGTHRVVARHCGETPLCVLSTGTNNAFPEMREATLTGLAQGFDATTGRSSAPQRRPQAVEPQPRRVRLPRIGHLPEHERAALERLEHPLRPVRELDHALPRRSDLTPGRCWPPCSPTGARPGCWRASWPPSTPTNSRRSAHAGSA
jgi:hypothetical protein